jgi:hypothetical protein
VRNVEHEPQSFLDQVQELAAAPRRLHLGLALEIIRELDRGLH